MKINLEVFAALQILKDNAENNFERHRIEVLENDLFTGPPKVEQIDDKHQRFQSFIFRQVKSKSFKGDILLHRIVYYYCYGEIPDDYQIHHVDNDKSNNNLENLQCLSRAEHTKVHAETQTGRFARTEMICEFCGKKFIKHYRGNNRFCSDQCRYKAGHIESLEVRVCAYCGKPFETDKSGKVIHCSVRCAQKNRRKEQWEEKHCPQCGKLFKSRKRMHQKYCSKECARKFLSALKHEDRFCLNCGKKFNILKSMSNKFCSRKCSADYHRSNGIKKPTRPEEPSLNSADN